MIINYWIKQCLSLSSIISNLFDFLYNFCIILLFEEVYYAAAARPATMSGGQPPVVSRVPTPPPNDGALPVAESWCFTQVQGHRKQWQYSRDSGIQILVNELSEICIPRVLLFRSEIQSTDTQIKYKPPIVTTRLNRLSYFVVYIFQSFFTFFNICAQIFTLSISPRSCRDSISFAYSCFFPESLLYCHC